MGIFEIAIVAALVIGAGWVAIQYAEDRRRVLRDRLAEVTAGARGEVRDEDTVSVRRPVPVQARRLLLVPGAVLAWVHGTLEAAGNRIGVVHLIVTWLAVWFVVTLFLMFVMSFAPAPAVVIGFVVGIGGGYVLLNEMQNAYQRKFLDFFPDALDLLVRAVRAGLPVVDALGVAAKEIPAPVGTELQRTLDEMLIGVEMEEAFTHTSNRLRIADFQFFVVSLILQRRTGGALAETLASLAALIRRRKEVRLKAKALSAEAKASAWVLACLPFVVGFGLYMINHELMGTLITDKRARLMLGLAITSLLVGIGVMIWMVKRSMR